MIRIFPPTARRNLAAGAFQLEKPPSQAGVFQLDVHSDPTVATVSESGLLSPSEVTGDVKILLVNDGIVLAESVVTVLGASTTSRISHITVDAPVSFLEANTLARGDEIVLYPKLVKADGVSEQGIQIYYRLSFSRDGVTFYSFEDYPDYIPEITVDKDYVNIGTGLFGFKLSCTHALASDLVFRISYNDTNGDIFTQDYFFSLTGPSSVSYAPDYADGEYEIDLGSTLTITGSVIYNDGSPTAPALAQSLTPEVLQIDPFGNVSATRSTFTAYPAFSNHKKNVWSFTEANDDIYVAASNKIYVLNAETGYSPQPFFTFEQGLNIRSLGQVKDTMLYTYISTRRDGEIEPRTTVYRIHLQKKLPDPVVYINEIGTAFSVVTTATGDSFCLLATRYNTETRLYLFSHNHENHYLQAPTVTTDGTVRKIIPGPDGWAYLLFDEGYVFLYNFASGNLQQVTPLYAGAQTVSASSQGTSLWLYKNASGVVSLERYQLSFTGNTASIDVISDYGTLNLPTNGNFVARADIIDDRHYIVFTYLEPDNTDFADPPPYPSSIRVLALEDNTDFINDHVGVLNLQIPVIGTLEFYSAEDPFISRTADFLIHPSNTKRAYFLYYTGTLLNLQTEVQNLLPVQVGFSDGTFSYNTDLTQSTLGDGVTLTSSGGAIFAYSSEYRQTVLTFRTSENTEIAREITSNFYPAPISVGIGEKDTPKSPFFVKKGNSLTISSFINLSGNRVYPYSLLVSGNAPSVAGLTQRGTELIVSGIASGVARFFYQTPQPLPISISGFFDVVVSPQAVPSYIRVSGLQDNKLFIPYRPASLVDPLPYSYPVSVSGLAVYSDDTTPDAYNEKISWVVASGSPYFSAIGNVFSFTPPPTGSNPIGVARAQSTTNPDVYREFLLQALPSEDETPFQIIFPEYVTRNENFVKLSTIPQGRIDFQVRRANNTYTYGNSIATFNVVGESLEILPSSLGTVSSTDKFGISVLKMSVGQLTGTVYIQVGGPERIQSLLPFYRVDAGSELSYATGSVYSVEGQVLDVPLSIKSSSPYEVTHSTSGSLRGSVTEFLAKPLSIPAKWVATSQEGTPVVLDDNGVVTYFDTFKYPVFTKKIQHEDGDADIVDMLRSDLGVLAFHKAGDKTFLMRKNGTLNFTNWGLISGTIRDLCLIGSRVYFTRQRGGSYEVGVLSKNAQSPASGNTLDYATTLISGIPAPIRLGKEETQVVCVSTGGQVHLIYDRDNPSLQPQQIFTGATIASPSFRYASTGFQDRNLLHIGSLALNPKSAGIKFYFTDANNTRIFEFNPYYTTNTKLQMFAEGYSTQTFTEVPITVLASGTRQDYYISASIANENAIYLGDSKSLSVKVYNSSGEAPHSEVSVYLNGTLQETTDLTFNAGGENTIKVVSKRTPTLEHTLVVNVRRRVRSVFVKNFRASDSSLAVNADSQIPLEAFVTYEDGYIDSNISVDIPPGSIPYVGQQIINGKLYLQGLQVTEGNLGVSVSISAKETLFVPQGFRTLAAVVRVYPVASRILSTLYVPTGATVIEQGTINAGVQLFYTDGTSEDLYAEGFQTDLAGLQTFSDLTDVFVDSTDTVYTLQLSQFSKYSSQGIFLGSTLLKQQADPFRKIRVLNSKVYVSTRYQIFRLDGSDLVSVYGAKDQNDLHNIVDFNVTSLGLQVIDITDTKRELVTIRDGATGVQQLPSSDISAFATLSDGSIRLLSRSIGIVDLSGNTVASLQNVNSLTAFGDELYVTNDHQVYRVLLDGTSTYQAGSVFSGLTNGPSLAARFTNPTSIGIDSRRRVFILDSGNQTIRRLDSGIVTSLVGGFWSSDNPEVAAGLGPQILASKPGIANLSVAYSGVTGTIKATVLPVYTRVEFGNTDFTTILGGSSTRQSVQLSGIPFTLSGPATGALVSEINYPAPVIWSCTTQSFITGTARDQLSPTVLGNCTVTATLSGVSPPIYTSATFETIPWLATGIAFDQTSYILKTNDSIDFSTGVKLAYNDSQNIYTPNVNFSGTTNGSSFTKTEEYEGLIRATTTVAPIFSAEVPVYVYRSGMGISFNLKPLTISSGVVRSIAAHHTGTGLFTDRFITYTASEDLSPYISISSAGDLRGNPPSDLNGVIDASSLLLSTVTGSKPITLSVSEVLSEFENPSGIYILHSGSEIPLSEVTIKAISSLAHETLIDLSFPSNFSLSAGAKATIVVTNDEPSVQKIQYRTTGSSALFTGTYVHFENSLPLPISGSVTYGIPLLAVSPTGVSVTIDGDLVSKVYLVQDVTTQATVALLYNNEYADFKYSPAQSSGGAYTLTEGENGILSLKGVEIGNPAVNQVDSSLTVTYDFDNSVKFQVPVVVTRYPFIRSISVVETDANFICLELSSLGSLTAEIKYTDNLSERGNNYEWVSGEETLTGASLTLASYITEESPKGVFFARSLPRDIEGRQLVTDTVTVYRTLADIDDPEALLALEAQGLLVTSREVKFTPSLSVRMDLGSTLSASIQHSAFVNKVSVPGLANLLPNSDLMLDSNKVAQFARKVSIKTSGSELICGDSRSKTQLVVDGVSSSIVRFTSGTPTAIVTEASTPYQGINLRDGYSLLHGGKVYTYAPTGSIISTSLSGISALAYHTGNNFFAVSPSKLYRLTPNFSTNTVEIVTYTNTPTGPFTQLLPTPAGSLRYLTPSGVAITSGNSLSLSVFHTGTYTSAVALSENQYFALSGTEVRYIDVALSEEYSLGSLSHANLGSLSILQPSSISSEVFALSSSGSALGISKSDNSTSLVVQYSGNPYNQAKLPITVLAPPQNSDYAIAFTPNQVTVPESGSFQASAIALNTNGTSSSVTDLTFDSSYLSFNNGTYKALKHGSTFLTGTTPSLTGTLPVSISPIVTGIVFASEYLKDPGQAALNVGTYLPYTIQAVRSDGSISTGITLRAFTVAATGGLFYTDLSPVSYSDGLLLGVSQFTGNVLISSTENPSAWNIMHLTVLAADDVRVSRFALESGPVALKVNESHFIDANIYYTNATSDNFVYTSLESVASGLTVVDSNIIKAIGLDSGHIATVKARSVAKIPAGLITSGTIKFTSDAEYGSVEYLQDPTGFISGLKILNSSNLSGVYYDFTTQSSKPTISQVAGSSFEDIKLVYVKDEAQIFFKPRYADKGKSAQLQVSLSGSNLTNNFFMVTVPEPQPVLAFESGTYYVVRGSDINVPLRLFAQYDSTTKILVEGAISGDFVAQEGSSYYLRVEQGNTKASGTITGTFKEQSITAKVVAVEGIPSSLGYFYNNERVSSLVLSPYYGTQASGALLDSTLNPITLVGVSSSLQMTGAGIVFTGGAYSGNYFHFTASGNGTSATGSVSYIGTTYTQPLSFNLVDTRVRSITLKANTQGNPPHSVFINQPFSFTLDTQVVPKASNPSGGSIRYGYTNPNLLAGEDFGDTNTLSCLDLFDFYIGSTKLSNEFSISGSGTIIDFTFNSIASTYFADNKPKAFTAKLKGTEISTSSSITIIIQELPYQLTVSNADLSGYADSN